MRNAPECPQETSGSQNRAKGIVAIVISAFGFSLMAMFVRLCDDFGGPVSAFQKGFFRNVVALAIAAAVWWRMRAGEAAGRASGPRPSFRSCALLLLRALLGTAGIFAHFYALGKITIAEGLTLNKTAPFFTVLFAWAFLGERAGRRHFLTLALAFMGVVLIAKPGFAGASAMPLAIGLASGVCAGGAYACVRALRRHALSPSVIILFFSAFSCLASVPFMLAGFDPMTWRQVLILLGAGGGAAVGQFGITMAYGYAAPKDIAVFDYSGILFAAAFGFLFFGQVPDLPSVLGFALILLAAYLLARARP